MALDKRFATFAPQGITSQPGQLNTVNKGAGLAAVGAVIESYGAEMAQSAQRAIEKESRFWAAETSINIDTEIDKELGQARQTGAWQGVSQSIDKKIKGLHQKAIGEAPKEIRDELRIKFMEQYANTMRVASKLEIDNKIKYQVGVITERGDYLRKKAISDPENWQTYLQSAEDIVTNSALSTAAQQEVLLDMRNDFAADVLGQYLDSNPAFVAKALKEGRYDDYISADVKSKMLDQARGSMIAAQQRQQAEYTANARLSVQNAIDTLKAGGLIPQQDLMAIAKQADSIGLGSLGENLRREASMADFKMTLSRKSPVEQEALISQMLSDPAMRSTKEGVERIKEANKIFNNTVSMAEQDPLGLANTNQIIALTPLQFDDAGNIDPGWYKERIVQAESASSAYGVDMKVFRPMEAALLAKSFSGAGLEEKAALVKSIAENAPKRAINAIAGQLSKDDSNFAAALAMAKDDTATTFDILQGVEAIKEKMVDTSGIEQVSTIVEQDFLQAVPDINSRKKIAEATKALYAAELAKGKSVSDSDIEDLYERLIGKPVNVNGLDVLPYRKPDKSFAGARELRQAARLMRNAEQIKRIHGELPKDASGNEVDLDILSRRAQFIPAGESRYIAVVNGETVVNSEGAPFEFDFQQINDAYQDRLRRTGKQGPLSGGPALRVLPPIGPVP